ncbi:alpha/beta fold hydrolase [Nocardioides litoris]|uniref:alpha/beta fold hydrolase n=1 Tax=Nocardioides litoris TaxID=1926648 RepID=UPI00111CBD04|nr:alpha/beta hydrolase [Nocardioides litoris]
MRRVRRRRALEAAPETGRPLAPAWPGIVEDEVVVGDRSVRVLRVAGRHGSGPGEPQLLVHGLGASAVTWVQVMEGLAERGPVVALDLAGFGGTRATPDDHLTVDEHVELVLGCADALGWSRLTLHGNSMGGLVSVLVAAAHPERVERVVLVSPALPPSFPLELLRPSRATIGGFAPIVASSGVAAALGLLRLAPEALDQRRQRALLGLIFGSPDDIDPDLVDLMAAEFAPDREGATPEERRRALLSSLWSIAQSWIDPRRVWRAIDAVEAPTMVVGGTLDALVPARVLRQVLARRRDWEGHVLDDRRHALMLEDPEAYLELVTAWYADAPAARVG